MFVSVSGHKIGQPGLNRSGVVSKFGRSATYRSKGLYETVFTNWNCPPESSELSPISVDLSVDGTSMCLTVGPAGG